MMTVQYSGLAWFGIRFRCRRAASIPAGASQENRLLGCRIDGNRAQFGLRLISPPPPTDPVVPRAGHRVEHDMSNRQKPIEPYPIDRPRAATIRSRLMLEVASELAGFADWNPKQARIQFRSQGATEWSVSLFGSDAPSAVREVEAGTTDFAIINPATAAGPALRGLDPFASAVPLRAIATIPSYDQLGIVVARRTGIETFDELLGERAPLRVSLRGERPDHSVHMILDHVLDAVGTSLTDWGATGDTISYDEGLPHGWTRAGAMGRGEIDLLIDEGVYNWVDQAVAAGFRFLPVPEHALQRLEDMGYRRGLIERSRYRALEEDIATVDFSGFMIYTHARLDDEPIMSFCRALEIRRDRIPWQGGPALPLERMVSDAVDAPIPIPFHPAAERFWREQGFLSDSREPSP